MSHHSRGQVSRSLRGLLPGLEWDAGRSRSDGTYYVYHGVHWAVSEDDGRSANGEIDFIIVYPEVGILV